MYESPWSSVYSDYNPLFKSPHAIYDNIPPRPVTSTTLFSRADSSYHTGFITAHLGWIPASDVDPGSGLEYHVVYRQNSFGVMEIFDDLEVDNYFMDSLIDASVSYGECLYRYWVGSVDVLGNVQHQSYDTLCLYHLSPPVPSVNARDCIEWEYSGPVDSFYVERSYKDSLLGSRWIERHSVEARSYIGPGERTYIFESDDTFLGCDTIYFHMKTIYDNYESPWSDIVFYTDHNGEQISSNAENPDKFELKQNFPNPFNPVTMISFNLPQSQYVLLRIFNIKGQVIRTLVDEHLPVGNYNIIWNGTDEASREVASGIYFYQIKTDKFKSSCKMTLIR